MAKKRAVKKTSKKKTSTKKKVAKAKISKKASPVKKAAKKKVAAKKKPSIPKKTVSKVTKTEVVKQALKTEAVKKKVQEGDQELSRTQIRHIERLIQKGAEWANIQGYLEASAKPYNMKKAYDEKTALLHPKMGLGYILATENDRLRVMFADGVKNLIMNYQK